MYSKAELVFIGTDGSMGLKHGKTYKVRLYTYGGKFWADWGPNCCPYKSVRSFALNWALSDQDGGGSK